MKKYRADVTLKFEGFVDVDAESKAEAKLFVQNYFGAILSNIHTCSDEIIVDWDFNVHPYKQINKIKLR